MWILSGSRPREKIKINHPLSGEEEKMKRNKEWIQKAKIQETRKLPENLKFPIGNTLYISTTTTLHFYFYTPFHPLSHSLE